MALPSPTNSISTPSPSPPLPDSSMLLSANSGLKLLLILPSDRALSSVPIVFCYEVGGLFVLGKQKMLNDIPVTKESLHLRQGRGEKQSRRNKSFNLEP